MEIQFPISGLHEGVSAEKQPPTTSPHLMNVRPFDVNEERARGGQRPGLTKVYTDVNGDPLGGIHPVLFITAIAHTYIPPETA